MTFSIRTLAAALALAPAVAFSQTSESPLTHARVMDQLMQLRHDGYVPSKIHYPADIQAAQARATTQRGTPAVANDGIGGTSAGTVQSGSRTISRAGWRSMYGRH